ncbi:MAG: ThuA domain-containing protein, partial [Microvirga sp.]
MRFRYSHRESKSTSRPRIRSRIGRRAAHTGPSTCQPSEIDSACASGSATILGRRAHGQVDGAAVGACGRAAGAALVGRRRPHAGLHQDCWLPPRFIPAAVAAIRDLAARHGIEVDHTEDAGVFRPDALARFKAVGFVNATGNVLDRAQQRAFEAFVEAGGGYLGIHSAADTGYDWPWYG